MIDYMTEYYIDIRCKVKADDVRMAIDKLNKIEEEIKTDDNVMSHFIKSVGVCLEYKDKMIGDRYEC